MCALVVWIHHSRVKILEPRYRLQQCWPGSAYTHLDVYVYMHTHTVKRRRSPRAWKKSRPKVLA